jgi:hypothetical protein
MGHIYKLPVEVAIYIVPPKTGICSQCPLLLRYPVSVHRTLLRVALLVFFLAEVLGAFGVSDYAHTGARYFINPGNPFFASAGLGAYLLYLRTKPGKKELALSFALGLFGEALLRHWRTQTAGAPLSTDWLTVAQTIGSGLGASGLLLSLGRAGLGRDEGRAGLGRDEGRTPPLDPDLRAALELLSPLHFGAAPRRA